jgi:hypothetical protein
MTRIILALALLLSSMHSQAEKSPRVMELQATGMMGALHLSYGATLWDKHTFSLGVGVVPELNYHDDMMIFSFKYRFTPVWEKPFTFMDYDMVWRPVSFSTAIIQGKDNDIYRRLPDDIPDGYYAPTATRILFSMQTNVDITKDIEAYWDWTVLEVGLVNYIRNFDFYRDNYKYGGLEGIVSFGVGLRIKL